MAQQEQAVFIFSICIPPSVDEKLEQDRATVDKVFEELSSHDNKIDKELFQQKVCFLSLSAFNKRFMVAFKVCPQILDASSVS